MPKVTRKVIREMIIQEMKEISGEKQIVNEADDVPTRMKKLAQAVADLVRNDTSHFKPAMVTFLKKTLPYQSSEFDIEKLTPGIRKRVDDEVDYVGTKIPEYRKLDMYQARKVLAKALMLLNESKEEKRTNLRETLTKLIDEELKKFRKVK